MTQVDEGHDATEAQQAAPGAGAPAAGDLLAQRYELVTHISDDAAGRQVWRGVDVILRRPVAVVLRYPGGQRAAEMLQAAVAASRVVHPNLVGVYDAVDEADRAFVVREWVEGASLRETVAVDGTLDPGRATTIAHAVAAAVAAVHATGMVHGNIHPGTVLIAQDGRVVLADARVDRATDAETDVRCVAGVLYFGLTGHWPERELPPAPGAPDAVRDTAGAVVAPRQMRAGVPAHLDSLAVELLDPRRTPPASDLVAGELARLDTVGPDPVEESGALRFAADTGELLRIRAVRPAALKIGVGVLALILLATVGTIAGLRLFGNRPGPTAGDTQVAPSNAPSGGAVDPRPIPLSASQVRIVDGDRGDRGELRNAEKTVDGDPDSAWETHVYRSPLTTVKSGIGILVDLGEARRVSSVRVQFSDGGATASLLAGDADPGSSAAGDQEILRSYQALTTEPVEVGGAWAFGDFDPRATYRRLLVWFTALPSDGRGGYSLGVQEITIEGP
ncbi:protein kinase family protein [Pilimelia columellifera subsp. columellifera]|uniref:Protein kinase family protein n=1 Tax=Pilimelia columellifera subsp. columellifera TaxID=706583 RepID=A0ABP6ABR4_9ACTN